MSADPIVYCLQSLTDYRQFERLCSDIMAGVGYPTINPLGGSNDRGRDAVVAASGEHRQPTIFAYSVRSDWRRKLREDCRRVSEEGHAIRRLVFACNSALSATEKDEAAEWVATEHDWELDLFDLERIRVLLASTLRHLIANHPSIFCPPWFTAKGGLMIVESRNTLVIDHVNDDHALASWLSRSLQVAGYNTWCYGTAPLGGEDADESVRMLIQARAARYLPVLSTAALNDADFVARCGMACDIENLTVPCLSANIRSDQFSTRLRAITPVRFGDSWREGLRSLLAVLDTSQIEAALGEDRGRSSALRSYMPLAATRAQPECVIANVFRVTLPQGIMAVELANPLTKTTEEQLRREWAFVKASPKKLLSFTDPPPSVRLVPNKRPARYAWDCFEWIEGLDVHRVVKELIRRSLDVVSCRAGLLWCTDRKKFYFPHTDGPNNKVSYQHVDGRNTWVSVTGEQTYGSGETASRFRYQLCPLFYPGCDESGSWWVTLRLYVRITDCAGKPHEKKAIGRRRKKVTKNWWNKQWLGRTLAVIQALRGEHESIEIGAGSQRMLVSVMPLEWACPVSIDAQALDHIGDFHEEMAAARYSEEGDYEDGGVDENGGIENDD